MPIEMLPLTRVTEKRYAGKFQALAGGYWHTNTPDGLFVLYHSQAISTDKIIGQNVGRFRDAELDRVLSAARQSRDPVELQALYGSAKALDRNRPGGAFGGKPGAHRVWPASPGRDF
ncbi:hypothetical protein P0D94_22745 [Pseudomonas sp. CBSPCGW29]|nr:hypothetical protein P0D94_22745 [Pseudomonas sp. CBSPCGW29]